ncbi:hypothetical protein AX17_003484 [Amanita inopinata Kibby_2008]|nr:hypothetical protein AX17_003484 [Amanita inopinata Kibby_2008]
MSRDRLAALRVQRQEQQQQAHELTTLQPGLNGHEVASVPAFLAEITSVQDSIDQLNGNIAIVATLHSRMANVLDDGPSRDAAQLDMIKAETRSLANSLKDRIKKLETIPAGPEAKIRRNQVSLLRSKFLEAIQNYQKVEQEYRLRSRQRVERQLKIVKPDVTADEVNAVIEGSGDQIFTQALTTSTRYGESRAAYREVQQRQHDLRKMEETLADLAQLFSDMAVLVEQQDETVNEIENTGKDVEANTKKGLEHTGQAVVHARRYRKARWICFIIVLIVCAVLAIVLGVVFGHK